MITRSILFLCKHFKWLDKIVNDLAHNYIGSTPKGAALIMKTKAVNHAKSDLNRVLTYDKLGELSGIEAPIIATQPQ